MLSMMLGSRRMLVKLALLGCFVVAALGTGGTDAGNPASDLNPRPSQVDIQLSEPANGGWVTSQISGKKEESCLTARFL